MKDRLVRVEITTATCSENGKVAIVENMFVRNPSRKSVWVKDFPKWMVSQLNMLRRLPETNYFMEGVGRRISTTIFWVVKPRKEKKHES
jgi:hypothetical protein|tara:strand:- start:466 stop:732 length:267 start_codon:yes stop_codon:yes gene_type:complete